MLSNHNSFHRAPGAGEEASGSRNELSNQASALFSEIVQRAHHARGLPAPGDPGYGERRSIEVPAYVQLAPVQLWWLHYLLTQFDLQAVAGMIADHLPKNERFTPCRQAAWVLHLLAENQAVVPDMPVDLLDLKAMVQLMERLERLKAQLER